MKKILLIFLGFFGTVTFAKSIDTNLINTDVQQQQSIINESLFEKDKDINPKGTYDINIFDNQQQNIYEPVELNLFSSNKKIVTQQKVQNDTNNILIPLLFIGVIVIFIVVMLKKFGLKRK